jgi:hypothetical protein
MLLPSEAAFSLAFPVGSSLDFPPDELLFRPKKFPVNPPGSGRRKIGMHYGMLDDNTRLSTMTMTCVAVRI